MRRFTPDPLEGCFYYTHTHTLYTHTLYTHVYVCTYVYSFPSHFLWSRKLSVIFQLCLLSIFWPKRSSSSRLNVFARVLLGKRTSPAPPGRYPAFSNQSPIAERLCQVQYPSGLPPLLFRCSIIQDSLLCRKKHRINSTLRGCVREGKFS